MEPIRVNPAKESCSWRAKRAGLKGSAAPPKLTPERSCLGRTAAAVIGIERIPQGINESGTAKDAFLRLLMRRRSFIFSSEERFT